MSPDEFFTVFDAQIVGLEPQNNLPEDFLRALPHQLELVLDTPTFAIGGWENSTDGPLVLGLDAGGQMVSLVSVNPGQAESLGTTLASIDEWLSAMTLRSLSDLSGNSVEFYEGLLDLSPNSSIVLSPRRRFVLVTAMGELDAASLGTRLPDADVDVRYLDVLQGPDGRAIIRGRDNDVQDPARAAATAPPITLDEGAEAEAETEAEPQELPVDEASTDELIVEELTVHKAAIEEPVVQEFAAHEAANEVDLDQEFSIAPEASEFIDLTDQADPIDLRSEIQLPTLAPDPMGPVIEAGGTYNLEQLPLLFDATGASLESISDELFAVNDSIVIVAELPERRRDSPFEDRHRFRWDTSLDRIQLLNEHGSTATGGRRVVHLFVESERQPGYAVYVGELNRTAFQTQTRVDGETAWFSISPSVQSDLYRMFRKGRLPQFDEGRTVDINTL